MLEVDFNLLAQHVFELSGDKIFIGGREITKELRDALRDEARTLQRTRLWEIMNASVTDQAAKIALIESQDFEHVRFAKALHRWAYFMANVVHTLAKENPLTNDFRAKLPNKGGGIPRM